jgi:threonine dehydrogenase-like Zn-dependent dehydrogenase
MIHGVALDGGMAEEILVPERCIVPLPNNVSATDACLVEPLAVAAHGIRMLDFNPAGRVAIIGAGRIYQAVVPGAKAPRVARVLPISLTFDHRVVMGGEAARFLSALLEDLAGKN